MSYLPIKNFDFKSITLITLNQIPGTITTNYQVQFNQIINQFLKNNFISNVAINTTNNIIIVPENCYVEAFLTLNLKNSINSNSVYNSFALYDLNNNILGVSGESRYSTSSPASFVSNKNIAFTFKLITNTTGKALGGDAYSNYIIIYEF